MATECSSSQGRVCLGNLDRLTILPIEVVYRILQDVPLREVVRTSVLSRTWRFRWMSLPNLVFDAHSIPPIIEGRRTTRPTEFVNHVLLLHNEKVSRFAIIDYLDRPTASINRWILLMARKSVKKLILVLPRGRLYKMPSSLLACQELRLLRLHNSTLTLPPSAKGFCKLVNLELRGVILTNETITSLIFNSPLQKLTLYYCYGFTHFDICAPNLTTFSIEGPCERVNFSNTPLLEYAYMGLLPLNAQALVGWPNGRCRLEVVLGGLVNVEELHILNRFMKILAMCMVPQRLCGAFRCLIYISLEINLQDCKEVLTVLCLFRSSPCLQEMHIKNCYSTQLMHPDEGESSEALLQQEDDMFSALETVGLTGFKGTQLEMGLVRFILLNAVVLHTMNVKWDVSCIQDDHRKARALEKMMQFQRTSPRAQAMFSNPV